MESYKNVMTIKVFNAKTGITIPVIRNLIRENKLVSFKVGNRIYINYLASMEKTLDQINREVVYMEKEIMTIKEFAEVMNLKEYVVRRLVKENKIVYFMSGTHAYINYPLSKKKLWNSSI